MSKLRERFEKVWIGCGDDSCCDSEEAFAIYQAALEPVRELVVAWRNDLDASDKGTYTDCLLHDRRFNELAKLLEE